MVDETLIFGGTSWDLSVSTEQLFLIPWRSHVRIEKYFKFFKNIKIVSIQIGTELEID